jgi:hypothetical protein
LFSIKLFLHYLFLLEQIVAYIIEFIYYYIIPWCHVLNFEWQQVAEMLLKRGVTEAVILIRVILWLLATRLGTLLICGSLCLSKEWPFINNFSSMSLDKREKIVQRGPKHKFLTPFRLTFAYIKVLCLFVFFSQVCLNSSNLLHSTSLIFQLINYPFYIWSICHIYINIEKSHDRQWI